MRIIDLVLNVKSITDQALKISNVGVSLIISYPFPNTIYLLNFVILFVLIFSKMNIKIAYYEFRIILEHGVKKSP